MNLRNGILVVAGLVLVIALGTYFALRPKPLASLVPANSLGYLEIPNIQRLSDWIQTRALLNQYLSSADAARMNAWFEKAAGSAGLHSGIGNHVELLVMIPSASVEADQTIKINWVLLARSTWVFSKKFNWPARRLAELFSDAHSTLSEERLHGETIAVLHNELLSRTLFFAVHGGMPFISNQRDAMAAALDTSDGNGISISKTPLWKENTPRCGSQSFGCGFWSGQALANLLREFLVHNYGPFDDAGRTSAFLDAVGLGQIRAVEFSSSTQSGGIEETWQFTEPPNATASGTALQIFLNQAGDGFTLLKTVPVPKDALAVKLITIKNAEAIWRALTNGIGILTHQEAEQNRDLVIAFFEGALGFRIDRDLLAKTSGAFIAFQINVTDKANPKPKNDRVQKSRLGWVLAIPSKDVGGLSKVFSKVVAEDRKPSTRSVGSATIFFSPTAAKAARPLLEAMDQSAAYAIWKDVLYFSTDQGALATALESLEANGSMPSPTLPQEFNLKAPYLAFSSPVADTPQTGLHNSRRETPSLSFSQIEMTNNGFQYRRLSPCGLLCDVLDLALTESK
ncbi:MAG: hypothetical protein PHX83_01095 [Acidobacteriia bacterium]|nr:hypothetical protein [Terriglobia bacterium]